MYFDLLFELIKEVYYDSFIKTLKLKRMLKTVCFSSNKKLTLYVSIIINVFFFFQTVTRHLRET